MPLCVMSEGAGPGAHLSRTHLCDLKMGADYTDKYVKGKVSRKGPLVPLDGDRFILKAVIEEEDSPLKSSINVVLFGDLAKDFSLSVHLGDVIMASGFCVAKSPTAHKDKLHACNLQLSGERPCIHVSGRPPSPPPQPKSPLVAERRKRRSEVSRATKTPKYTYVNLGDLKAEAVVNVYAVVVFFKQPFKSRGTDFCSTLKLTDQTDLKVSCNIFRAELEDHPKIFNIGDIVRLHRVKVKFFSGSITLLNTHGFSVVTFDGAVGGAVEPRTSSRSFHFDQRDQQTVQELRSWASSRSLIPAGPTIRLSAVQPRVYFDLTCQLLSSTLMDSTCTLLRVWDGTRCPHPLLRGRGEPSSSSSSSKERQNLVASVFVYDNHVELAQQLKPGAFLRIYNLRAVQGAAKLPGQPSDQAEQADHLTFHLHGGTAYGRGIRTLPENDPDVQEVKRLIEAFPEEEDDLADLNFSDMEEVWSTPPESLGAAPLLCSSERRCGHGVAVVSLAELKQSDRCGTHHVRARIRSYQPLRLHQALKLYCCKCSDMLDVPDHQLVSGLFPEAPGGSGPCSPPAWALSAQLPSESSRALTLHLSRRLMSQSKTKELLFLQGSTLEETHRLASAFPNIVPVRSSEGQLAPLDLRAPFLFRGRRSYYGCGRCSQPELREPPAEQDQVMDEKLIAEALGVQLLQVCLLMKMQLQDTTDTLDVFLWRDADTFFGVSVEDVTANQEAQDIVQRVMDSLCPAGGSVASSPWLDVCVRSYRVKGDDGLNQTCYQICQTAVTLPA
ncbi:protection of telomeres protein 1 isoform X2 [Genypterus blacodes]|uniref:protection of telomeres protein 1 isoform X2 n=1 Tax=Genypterus blacodes TaxID=154954 RepID=UPI003F76A8CC